MTACCNPSRAVSRMLALSAAGALLALPPSALAGGFYLKEQSAEGVGRAFAGETALASNASTVYFNPGGMTRFSRPVATAGAYALFIDSEQTDQGTTRTAAGPLGSFSAGGNDGGNPFDTLTPTGNFYAVAPIDDDRWWAGIGINTPYGFQSDYDPGFFGRYDSLKSDLMTVNIQPSIAYKLNEIVSIGGGINFQYVDVELTNALPNAVPGSPDGLFKVEGDDWSVGWNLGMQAHFDRLDLGVHYRSQVEHDLDGDLNITGLTGPLAAQNGTFGAAAPLTLPDIVSAGAVYHVPDGKTRLLGDVTWFNWADFERIAVSASNGARFDSPQNYEDTWAVALGAEHDVSQRLTLRTGVQFDETPTRDSFRTTRVPDGDRWWLTGGATYELSDTYSLALSYAHIFVSEESLERTDRFYEGTPAQVNSTLRSRNAGDADILAVGLTAAF
ncbi:long chain fatty acid transport protein [Tepidicaulis marinus]|uniref:Long chain fatty acid transport protein n=1 Tax=Tepidicaulis marinus TaxID=1333998 RepID=A0A081BFB6_9HYPH|nr:outer membrane protein transport protein [Tepidicaulis marinus]GAK46734.1 long chain fatty acid transport protein [Tepidicaulis marinus]